jgi:iron complex outermembrane receptor protein
MALLACCHLLAAAAAVAAQPPTPDRSDQDSIIVTGERVKRPLKDTPASVTVLTQTYIEPRAADRLDQLLAGLPNVQLGNGTEGPAIRGQDTTGVLVALSSFLGGGRPRATIEVDGRTAGFQEFIFGTAPLWDVRQVEVFRTPQTVTRGRNSIAGGIVVRTNDPTYEWTGGVRGIADNFRTWQGSAVASGPLVDQQLAFRAAVDVRSARTTSKLGDTMRGANPNVDRYDQLRFKLLAEPKALPGLRMVATYAHTHSQSPQVVTAVRPFRERRDSFPTYGIFGVDVDSLTFDARQALDGNSEFALVASVGDTQARRFAIPGLGEARIHLRDLSIEPFVNWRPEGRFSARGGIHLDLSRLGQVIDITGIALGIGRFHDRQQSLGVFGEGEFAATDRLTLTLGGRYQSDSQHRVGALSGPPVNPLDFDKTFTAFLPKLTAEYRLSRGLTAGALVEKAYNPGGVTLNDFGEVDTFAAERLWDYELFLKGAVAPRLSIAANLFYNTFRDAQRELILSRPGPNGPLFYSEIENQPKATSYGAEIELSWRPGSRLELGGGIGLLKTRIDRTVFPDDPRKGNEFGRAPHLTAAASADWKPVDRLQFSAQVRHHSAYFGGDDNAPESHIRGGTIVDARVAYTVRKVTMFAYAHNLFDRFQLLSVLTPDIVVPEDPRVAGLGIEARF